MAENSSLLCEKSAVSADSAHCGTMASRPASGKEDLQSNGLPPRWDVGEHKVCGQELDNSDKDVAQEKVYSAHGSGLFLDLGVSSCCWICSCAPFCSILFMVLCRKTNYTTALHQKNKEPTHGLQQLLVNGVPVH